MVSLVPRNTNITTSPQLVTFQSYTYHYCQTASHLEISINQQSIYLKERYVFVRSRPNSCAVRWFAFFPLSLLESIDCREFVWNRKRYFKWNTMKSSSCYAQTEANAIFTLNICFNKFNWNNFLEIYDCYFCKDEQNLVSACSLFSRVLFFFSLVLFSSQPGNILGPEN